MDECIACVLVLMLMTKQVWEERREKWRPSPGRKKQRSFSFSSLSFIFAKKKRVLHFSFISNQNI